MPSLPASLLVGPAILNVLSAIQTCSPHNNDHRLLGATLGPPIFGNSHSSPSREELDCGIRRSTHATQQCTKRAAVACLCIPVIVVRTTGSMVTIAIVHDSDHHGKFGTSATRHRLGCLVDFHTCCIRLHAKQCLLLKLLAQSSERGIYSRFLAYTTVPHSMPHSKDSRSIIYLKGTST